MSTVYSGAEVRSALVKIRELVPYKFLDAHFYPTDLPCMTPTCVMAILLGKDSKIFLDLYQEMDEKILITRGARRFDNMAKQLNIHQLKSFLDFAQRELAELPISN